MLVYILKSIACLSILFVFYKIFLEKENMHVFKRFYLLGALLFSMIIPSLVFTEYIVVEPEPMVTASTPVIMQQAEYSNDVVHVPQALETDVIDIAPILWGVYFIGLFFFGLKFIRNLFQIYKRIRKNPKQKLSRFTQVLLQEKITPHTFFSYIFLNRKKFEADQIPAEVLLHEQTHASQKHSWDVILVELLHVIFWINPFIYLTKKAIKLNHEFLADQAVLKENIDKTTYQNTLLSYLSPDSEKKYQPLANAINYSSIKKRFTVMKTHTSKKAVLLRSLLLLPLLAVLFLSFSETNLIEVEQFSNDHTSRTIRDIVVDIDKYGNLSLNNKKLGLNEIGKEAKLLTSNLSNGERKNFITAHILYNEENLESIEHVQSQLFEVGIHQINHVSKQTSKAIGRPNFIPSKYQNKTIEEARAIQKETFAWHQSIWFDIKNENEIWYEDKLIPLEGLADKISNIASSKNEENSIKVQFYSTGILHSNFVDKINAEAQKANVKEVQVSTEEFIMKESDYEDIVGPDEGQVHLHTNKMTLANDIEPIIVKINNQGQILVGEKIVALKNLKELILKTNSNNRGQQKTENVKVNVYVNVGSSEQILYKVTEALSEFGIVNIHPTGHLYQGQEKTTKEIVIHINKNGKLLVQDELVPLEDLNNYLSKINSHLTKEQRSQIINSKINIVPKSPENIIDKVYDILYNYGSATIDFRHLKDGKYAILEGNANSKQITEYNALAKKYNAMIEKSRSIQIKMKDVKRLEYIYGLMSKKQKAAAEPFPDFPELPPVPDAPKVPSQREEAANIIEGIIEEQDPNDNVHARLYSHANKKDFTAIQESPSAPRVLIGEASNIPQPVSIHETVLKLEKTSRELEKTENELEKTRHELEETVREIDEEVTHIRGEVDNQDMYGADNVRVYQHNVGESKTASPKLMKSIESLVKRDAQFYFEGKKVSTKEGLRIVKSKKNILIETHPYINKKPEIRIHTNPNDVSIPKPPTPPEPVSPLDHVIDMAKKNAVFYLEGKEITSDKAIEVMKKNKDINIDSRSANGKRPVVKMSTKPIKIGHVKRPLNNKKSSELLATSDQFSSQIEDPNRPKATYAKQIIDKNNQKAIFYHKGKKIDFYKALDIVYSKRSLSLATFTPNNSSTPVVILDRNFKNYNFKELMNSK